MPEPATSGPPHGRFRYGPWPGGPDPLAPPYDVRAALDEVGRDVLAGGSLRDALRELLRRGLDGRAGLDELRRAGPPDARARPAAAATSPARSTRSAPRSTRRSPPSGTTLAGRRRRRRPAGRDGAGHAARRHRRGGAGAGRLRLAVATRPARRTSRSATCCGSEVLDAQFAGLKQALSAGDPAGDAGRQGHAGRPQRRCWPRTPAARTPTDQFASSWTSTATSSPSNPQNVDELIDALARRQAAAERLMGSLSPRAARGAGPADERRARRRRPRLARWRSSSDNLRALRPGLDRADRSSMRPGGESLGYGDAVEAVAELADLEALEQQLSQGTPARPWTTSTSSGWSSTSARPPPRDVRGAARAGARAGAAGLRHPRRRRAAPDPARLRRLGRDRAQAGLRAARRRRRAATTTTGAPGRPTS